MTEYTPSEAQLRIAWSDYCQSMDACNAWVRPDDVDLRAEFDRFLARVRRDAERTAATGLAAAHRAIAVQARADGDPGRAHLHDWAATQADLYTEEQNQ